MKASPDIHVGLVDNLKLTKEHSHRFATPFKYAQCVPRIHKSKGQMDDKQT